MGGRAALGSTGRGAHARGRLYWYHPAVSEQDVRESTLSWLVQKLFRGSPLRVVAHMVERDTLSADEMRRPRELLDQRLPARSSAVRRPPRAGAGPPPEAADHAAPGRA